MEDKVTFESLAEIEPIGELNSMFVTLKALTPGQRVRINAPNFVVELEVVSVTPRTSGDK